MSVALGGSSPVIYPSSPHPAPAAAGHGGGQAREATDGQAARCTAPAGRPACCPTLQPRRRRTMTRADTGQAGEVHVDLTLLLPTATKPANLHPARASHACLSAGSRADHPDLHVARAMPSLSSRRA